MALHTIEGSAGRLDSVLAARLGVTRAEVQRAIDAGHVVVDGVPRPKSFKLAGGEVIVAEVGHPGDLQDAAEGVPVLYEDAHLLIVSKPAGVLTHPTASTRTGTLVNRLLALGVPLSLRGGPDRAGIVHRLDAGTSGLMIVAKDDRTHEALSEMFREHVIDRRYLALVRGTMRHDEFLIEAPLQRRGGRIRVLATAAKDAATRVSVLERLASATLVEARPRTGRTHQIRVHLDAVGHSILGDRAYGGGGAEAERLGLTRPFLHSWKVAFDHPLTGSTVDVEDALPPDLAEALERARAL